MDWLEPHPLKVSESLRNAVGGHPLVAEILTRRGFDDVDAALSFLDPDHYRPASPTEIPDVDAAAHRLKEAVEKHERILVWGDFDVDGQTSTSLLVAALKALVADVTYHVPHRMKHGHGVQPDVLNTKILEYKPAVLLTCDTGVAAHKALDVAQAAGVDMLITDHHALPPTLPDATAVVNPQRLPAGHVLRDLPGVGVGYMLILHLYDLLGRRDEALEFLDLVALGIVSDVATQHNDTRYLLQRGLDRLRTTKRVGLDMLMMHSQVDRLNLSSDTIGFQIGPRLNALGRLDDATEAVKLLTTNNELIASTIAAQLEVLNNKRKQIEDQIYSAAQEQVINDPSLLEYEGLVLYGENWHAGVVGIVASRLVEQYGKPTVLLTSGGENIARGSARSIPGVDIGASIAAHSEMLIGHGGHPGAAGLSLEEARVPEFRRRLSKTIAETRDRNVKGGYQVDAEVGLEDLSMELAEELNRLAPFGAGNPPIHLMTRRVEVLSHATFGSGAKHRRVLVADDQGVKHEVTWWRGADYPVPNYPFDLLYVPRINDYKGRRSLQLEWVDARPAEGIVVDTGPRFHIHDLRRDPTFTEKLPSEPFSVWAEGDVDNLPFGPEKLISRLEAGHTERIVIWTAPPGPLELEDMLATTGVKHVYVLAKEVPDASAAAFTRRLAGLVKYTLNHYEGKASITQFAVATAQREVSVRRGLSVLESMGQITVEWLGQQVKISKGGAPDKEQSAALQDDLHAILAETSAYRSYFRNADLETFFQT